MQSCGVHIGNGTLENSNNKVRLTECIHLHIPTNVQLTQGLVKLRSCVYLRWGVPAMLWKRCLQLFYIMVASLLGDFSETLQPNNTLLNLSAVLLNPVRLALDGLKHMLMHQGAPRTESKPHRLLEPLLGQPGVSESQEDLSCFVVSPRCEPAVTYRQHPHTQLYKSHKVSRNLGWNTGCIQTPCNVYVYL